MPIDEVVDVDLYLPGCPPHPYFIALAVRALLGAKDAVLSAKPVCSDCNRTMKRGAGVTLKKGAMTVPDAATCMLSQGVPCMGSVSLNRCRAQCPNSGVACSGCAGPSLDVITEPHHDVRTLIARRMHLIGGVDEAEVRAYLEANAKTFYAYAMASPVMHKVTVDPPRAFHEGLSPAVARALPGLVAAANAEIAAAVEGTPLDLHA